MGGNQLTSIRYSGDGTGFTFGQAYLPGTAWPKITVHSLTRSVDYATNSMRDEIVFSRAEPRGGGGYPLTGQQRNDQYLSGEYAWNVSPTGPASVTSRSLIDRAHQLWITPHGVIKAALKEKARLSWIKENGRPIAVVSFSQPGRFSSKAFLNNQYLVERVESRFPDQVLGEVSSVTEYRGYQPFGPVQFPTQVKQTIGGHPVLELSVKEVTANAPVAFEVPEPVRAATERVTTEKVADGVWFIGGGSHNSVAIERSDHVLLVEAPLSDARAVPVMRQVKELVPGKPIRYVINTHAHFDHAGGVRAAVAEGATIVTQAANQKYFDRAFSTPARISPDALAKSGKKARFLTVADKLDLDDATRTVQVQRIEGGVHSGSFLLVYLPKERLLVEADAFTPGPPDAAPPPVPNANNLNLIENIERLKLSVDRILPLHGRVVPLGELYRVAGRTPTR
jgi:glyoxylase-like metal-dependent hydrolase (beta-lactamase superfamily II)